MNPNKVPSNEPYNHEKHFADSNYVDGIQKETGNFQSTVWNHNLRPHSYEIGKIGNRHKVYWETLDELKELIDGLVDAGYLSDEEVKAFKSEHVPYN